MAALNTYPVNTTPLLTDRLPMIDDPGGTWGVEQVTISAVGAVAVATHARPSLAAAGFVAGADCTSAMAALTGGAYFLPAGTYYLDSTATVTLTGSLSIVGVPGRTILECRSATGFANGTSDGNFWTITTNGSNTTPCDIHLDGITLLCGTLPNTDPGGAGTAWPVDANARAQWPQANNKGNGTTNADALRISDAWCDTVRLVNMTVVMDDKTNVNHHWVGSGGDSGITIDMEEIRYAEVAGSAFYGSSDSGVYMSQVGTRSQTSRYPAKLDIHDNYFEGCGNGIHAKGSVLGGQIHHNTFVNCANSIGCTNGNEAVSEFVRIAHNTIDGYWQAIRIQGFRNIVEANTIFNGGHFAEDGTSMSDSGATLDDFFDQPTVFTLNGAATDSPDRNIIRLNDIWPEAANGSFGRAVDWGGSAVRVFAFEAAENNDCHDNSIHGTGYAALAVTSGASTNNIISWSSASMIDAHDEMVWTGKVASEKAQGPVADVTLAAQFAGLTSDTSYQTPTGFQFEAVVGGVYDIDAGIAYIASAAGDMKCGFTSPGTNVNTGVWGAIGPGQVGTAPLAVFDAPGTNKATLNGNGDIDLAQIRGRLVCGSGGGGTVELQVGQNTSDATATSVEAGSWLRVLRVA